MYVCIYVCMYIPQTASAVGVLAVHLGTGYLVHRQISCFCAFIFVRRLRERWGSRRSRLRETARSRRFCCKKLNGFLWFCLPDLSGLLVSSLVSLGAFWAPAGWLLGTSLVPPGESLESPLFGYRAGVNMYMYVCIYVYMYICMYVYMYICMYVCMYVCYSGMGCPRTTQPCSGILLNLFTPITIMIWVIFLYIYIDNSKIA